MAVVTRVVRPFAGQGPVHALCGRLAWCGIRPSYRHVEKDGALDDVTCRRCLTALRKGTPRAWKGR